jgi:hypothetical protein
MSLLDLVLRLAVLHLPGLEGETLTAHGHVHVVAANQLVTSIMLGNPEAESSGSIANLADGVELFDLLALGHQIKHIVEGLLLKSAAQS